MISALYNIKSQIQEIQKKRPDVKIKTEAVGAALEWSLGVNVPTGELKPVL